ncbi:Coiled-coil domain-containing protein 65 [Cyphomyrmex costatus]|uniref:Dynein regulatory complex subunit 2 n=2 Tax=Cyphomyrmex costatus TaxID=456900 RepID=A0A195CJI3_9HYME|nr:Coiled-coil domain-containing protein 65 [Cyphomyrmex costatus]
MWKKYLMHEIELGALNTKHYRTLWRKMMTRIKMPQITEDVKIAWHNFDRAFDIKDYRISFLMDELAEAEEQYQKTTKSYTEIIDRFLKLHREGIQSKERNCRRTLNEILVQTDTYIGIGKIYYQQNEVLLQSISNDVHKQLEELLDNVKSIALSKIDAFVEDSKDVRRISVTQLENRLQRSWENLQQILLDYQNKIKHHKKSYEILKDKDEKNQEVIAQQLLRTTSLFEDTRKFQGKIRTYDFIAKKKISKILIENDFFEKASWTVKFRLLSEQMKDKNQLKILSIRYNKMIKYLEFLIIKGKQLLTLMQICSKYKTQNEKIIPFVDHTKSTQMFSSYQIVALSNLNVPRQITNFQDLTNFWRQFGVVQMITIQLRLERNNLKAEVKHLRESISFYIMQKE